MSDWLAYTLIAVAVIGIIACTLAILDSMGWLP